MWQSLKFLNVSNTLTLKQIFWKTKFFKKLEYRFLVESTKIENASFPYKTAILEANVKTNKTVTTKWTSQKEQSFPFNYLIFLEILFQFKNKELICCTNHPKNKNKSWFKNKELICCTNHPNSHICTFFKRWSFN